LAMTSIYELSSADAPSASVLKDGMKKSGITVPPKQLWSVSWVLRRFASRTMETVLTV
jgi:hypothetical protein